MKAFLSHSSHDKEFVRAVAEELARQYCVIDENAFETGEDFRKAIEKGLTESSVFVFFATKSSLQSVWVEFEIDEAWYQILQKQLSHSLVYILDSSVQPSDLPKWLQRGKIKRANAPKPVAREIRQHLDELIRHKQSPFFIGRTRDIERLQQIVTPPDGSTPPRAIVVSGLPGIGRRALVRHISRPLLNLPRHVLIHVQDGDDTADIAIKIADVIEPYSTPAGFEKIANEITSAPPERNTARILRDLRLCTANGDLPIFLDEGGLLDEEGRFNEPFRGILSGLTPSDPAYLCMVSTRRPNTGDETHVPVVHLNALSSDESKMLIATLANRAGLQLQARDVTELSEYTGGFPPACSYAIQLAVDYGLAVVLADKRRLVEFRTTPFIKYLTEKRLSDGQSGILRILASYSPLPLPVIGKAVGIEPAELADQMMRLIDYALIVTDEQGLYSIADPIMDAVVKMSRFVVTREHSAVAHALRSYISTTGKEDHQLDLGRVLYRAATNANEKELAASAFHLANDVIQLAEHHYHSRDYEQAIAFGREAVNMRPKSFTARSFLIRALIQEGHWREASDAIAELRAYAPVRDVYFLQGFLERKRGNTAEAIRSFEQAQKLGRAGGALMRELAFCYFIEGDLKRSAEFLDKILPDNLDDRFIVDFSIQLATKQGDEKLARRRLEQLAPIDSAAFYLHRKSRVELSFGHINEAREAAQNAIQLENRPSFEMICQLAVCELKMGNLDKAEELIAQLDTKFQRVKFGFRINLRALLEVAKKRYSNALAILEKQSDKADRFYMQLRKEALEGELQTSALTDAVREKHGQELRQLESELAGRKILGIEDLIER